MLYLVLAIVCSSLINWLFRIFQQQSINTLQAIVINYFTCTVIGQLWSGEFIFSPTHAHQDYFWFTLILGTLFIGIFFCMAKTTALFGVSANAVSSKMGLIFPTLFFFFYLKESLTILHWFGIGLALLAVVLINKKNSNQDSTSKAYYYPLLVFFGSGIIDTCMKWIDISYLKGASPLMPTTTIFTGAFLVGIVVLIITKQWNIKAKEWLAGIALGIPNYFSIYFLLLALHSFQNQSTGSIFATNNVGVILVSTLGGVFLFKESLNTFQYIGLVLSVLTIIIMTYAF